MSDNQPSWANRPWENESTPPAQPSGAHGAPVPPKKQMSTAKGCLGLFGIIALIGAGCGVLASAGGDDGASGVEVAKYTCRDAVKDRLNAPSTAKFRNESSSGIGPYTVSGIVEAENALGGRVSKTYTCTVTDAGKGYQRATATLG